MAGALYRRLPAWMPTHWNASGRADGFIAKPWGPIILPLVITGLVVGVIVWTIRRSAPASEDPAITELKSRLARGDIDPAEYQARLDVLKADD